MLTFLITFLIYNMIIFLLAFILIIWGGVNIYLIPGNDELFICLSLSMFFLLLLNSSGKSIKLLLYSDLKSLHIVFKKTLKFNEVLLEWINKMQTTLWSNKRIFLIEFYFAIEILKFNIIRQDFLKILYSSIFNWMTINLAIYNFRSSKKYLNTYLFSLTNTVYSRLFKARVVLMNINIIKWLI